MTQVQSIQGHEADDDPIWPERGRAAVVIAGAGARGAYEAGALAELLPALFPGGLADVVLLGTSAGAVNAALWAQYARPGRPLAEVGAEVCGFWRELTVSDVYRPLLASVPHRLWDFLCGGVASVLDTAPLAEHVKATLQPDTIAQNIRHRGLGGVGLVATSCPVDGTGGRSRVFLQCCNSIQFPKPDPTGALDYVPATLSHEHVLASTAIPIAFPAQPVSAPDPFGGYYCDGGVRLNAPIKPALALEATRLVVVSSHSTSYPRDGAIREPRDVVDAAAQVLHVVLADGLIEDLRALRRTNRLVRQARERGTTLIDYSQEPARPYVEMPIVCVSPKPGELAGLAQRIVADPRARQLPAPRRWEYQLMRRLFAGFGSGPGNDELLSYLLFDPGFAEQQIERGRRDARSCLHMLNVLRNGVGFHGDPHL